MDIPEFYMLLLKIGYKCRLKQKRRKELEKKGVKYSYETWVNGDIGNIKSRNNYKTRFLSYGKFISYGKALLVFLGSKFL